MTQTNDTKVAEGQTPAFDKALAESLCNLEIPDGIGFSPNGDKVLYATSLLWDQAKGKNPVGTLWLASTALAGSSRPLTSGLFDDQMPRFHPDGNRVAFISDRAKAGESSALWVLRLDGGDPHSITPVENEQEIELFSFSPNGATIAYISADEKSAELKEQEEKEETDAEVWGERWEHARLRLVDVESKKVTTLVSQERHVSDLTWSPDGKEIVFNSIRSPEIEEAVLTGTTISIVNVETGKVRDLCTVPNELENITWMPDGKVYFQTFTPDDSMLGAVVLYVVDPAAESPRHVKVAYGEEEDVQAIRQVNGKLIVGRSKRLGSIIGELGKEPFFKKETDVCVWNVFFDKSTGDPVLAASISDLNTPYEVCVVKGDEIIRLSDHGKDFKDREFGTSTVITCQSADGEVELDGIYLTPTGKAGDDGNPKSPLPTFVMIHGGPTDHNSVAFDAYYYNWAQYVLSKGYGVLLPQYRGGNGRGVEFALKAKGGQGKCDYNDVITITDNAVSRGFADGKKLIVGGYSQGGFLTYMCSVRNGLHGHGWRFNATIAGAGVTDLDSLPSTADLGTTYDTELSNGNVPWNMDRNDTSNRRGSALWEIASAVAEGKRLGQTVIPPMLILHGEADIRCPTTQAQGFRRALRAYNLPCEYVTYPRQGHSIKEQKFWLDMLERIGRWCDTYIGPTAGNEVNLTINPKPNA